jgi:hypothetical protein
LRRFPAPWTVEALDGGFKVVDANGQTLAYVYGHADVRDAGIDPATLSRMEGAGRHPIGGATRKRCNRRTR